MSQYTEAEFASERLMFGHRREGAWQGHAHLKMTELIIKLLRENG